MAATKKKRLFKIASEINIGKDAIIEFLQSKGFDIKNKPTSLLNGDMVDAVYEKFKKEKIAIEKQREKLQKHKKARAPEKKDEEVTAAQESETQATKQELDGQEELQPSQPVESTVAAKAREEIEEAEPVEADDDDVEVVEDETVIVDAGAEELESKEVKEELEADTGAEDIPSEEELDEKQVPDEKSKKIAASEEDTKEAEGKEEAESADAEGEKDPNKLKGLTVIGKIDLQDKEKKPRRPRKKISTPEEETAGPGKAKKAKKKKLKIVTEEDIKAEDKKYDKKRKKRKSIRDSIKSEDVEAAIKKTLADMESDSSGTSRSKIKQKRKLEREEKEAKKLEELEKESAILQLTEFVTTSDLANLMKVTPNDIILKCMELGLMVTINQRLDKDTITLIADDYGYQVEFLTEKTIQEIDDFEDPPETLKPRPPIVTIMGHVDHGKTSLLDYIRQANVVAGEAGGITQHIGAYRVELPGKKYITFLDTPGHEAFTAMRARGAQVTDIVVLVVAADDSVMPQTQEAISHAQAANVPIIVAINKMDKPDAQPDRIKQQLADQNILVESWGGKYQSVEISAKTGMNVDSLLEGILLESELLDLKANPDRQSRAAVVEANMDKGFGPVCTVIVQKGTLKIGDSFVAGIHYGRVRAMFDERNKKVKKAGPAIPVRVVGFDGLPEAGDLLTVTESDSEAKNYATQRAQRRREQEFRQVRHVTLDDISQQISAGGVKELPLIIKGDVSGSVEALSDSLMRLSTEEVKVLVIHKGVGSITESDVMLAKASGAIIVGFQVSPNAQARKAAEIEAVDIRIYNIIYDCIDEIRLALEGLLTPDTKEDVTSSIEIRKIFKVSKAGYIAGCYVKSGKIHRNDKVRVVRDGLPIYKGELQSLKRGKDDVKEVDTGFECGIQFTGFQDFEIGDIIEGYKIIEIKRELSV